MLTGCRLLRENTKRDYLKKCSDEIKNSPGSTVAIASLKHIYDILNSHQKCATKSLKVIYLKIFKILIVIFINKINNYII